MDNQIIHYKIISDTSFNTYEKPTVDALNHISQYVQDNSAWLYINMKYMKIEDLTADILKNADSITVTRIIIGG